MEVPRSYLRKAGLECDCSLRNLTYALEKDSVKQSVWRERETQIGHEFTVLSSLCEETPGQLAMFWRHHPTALVSWALPSDVGLMCSTLVLLAKSF